MTEANGGISVFTIHTVNSAICTPIGLFLNLFLAWLIVAQSGQELKVYSIILIQTCVTDSLMLITCALNQPVMICGEQFAASLTMGPLHTQPIWVLHTIHVLWYWSVAFSFYSISVQFIYRYLAICKQKQISFLAYMSMLSVPALILTIYMSVGYVTSFPDQNNRYLRDPMFLSKLGTNLSDEPVPFTSYSRRIEFQAPIAWQFYFIGLILLDCICFSLVCFFSWKIYWHLKAHINQFEQSRLREMERQISIVLFLQTALPVEIMIVGLFQSMRCGRENQLVDIVSILPINWWPILNPLITIFFIRKYRQFIMKCLLGCCKFRKQPAGQIETTPRTYTSTKTTTTTDSKV